MTDKNISSSSLATNALSEIPEPNANAQEITALVKESGQITGYQLADGSILDKPEAVELAKVYGEDESFQFINGILGNIFEHLDKTVG